MRREPLPLEWTLRADGAMLRDPLRVAPLLGADFHRVPFAGRTPFAGRAALFGRSPFVGRGPELRGPVLRELELRASVLRRATRPLDEVCAWLRSRECATERL